MAFFCHSIFHVKPCSFSYPDKMCPYSAGVKMPFCLSTLAVSHLPEDVIVASQLIINELLFVPCSIDDNLGFVIDDVFLQPFQESIGNDNFFKSFFVLLIWQGEGFSYKVNVFNSHLAGFYASESQVCCTVVHVFPEEKHLIIFNLS